MSAIKVIFYGLIQGFTEFLPISSSGHLAIFQNIFGLGSIYDMLLFNLVLHLGTLAAVFVAYFKDIKLLIIGFFTLLKKIFTGKFSYKNLNDSEKFVILVLTATIPLIVAVFLDDKVESIAGYTKIVGILLLINAFILFFSDKIAKYDKLIRDLKPRNAFYIGLFQLIAILPGISRSGMTITGGLFNGMNRENAVKFSFIMSIPAILGASVFKFFDVLSSESQNFGSEVIISHLLGAFTAFLSGLCAIVLLRYITKKKKFLIFSVYCVIAGAIAIIFG